MTVPAIDGQAPDFRPVVYCADIGSTTGGAFAWAWGRPGQPVSPGGNSIEDLVSRVASDLEAGTPVALGFECPLFVPLAQDPLLLTAARDGDGNRSWSAGAGAAVLTTGLTQVVWMLRGIRQRVSRDVPAFLRWDCFREGRDGLLLWEAFVSGGVKTGSHVGDAARAVDLFLAAWPDLDRANVVRAGEVYSLVGAALLRSGWTDDTTVLSSPCLVVGARRRQDQDAATPGATDRSRGARNSMRTRVQPVFCELVRRDPTGATWLSKLLVLAAGSARPDDPGAGGPLLEARFGTAERPLEPPRALLRWLVEHPDALEQPRDDRPPDPKRAKLLAGADRERRDALRLLERPRIPDRTWYVLEGASYPDVFLRTQACLVVIEGKRTEAGLTTHTTWMPVRHQMLRHLDGAWEIRSNRAVFGFFIVEGAGGPDATVVPEHWVERCATTVSPDVLERSLPHRSAAERTEIARSYLGVTTWQAVCQVLDIAYGRLPDRL